MKEMDLDKWCVETQESTFGNNIKFIIVKWNKDNSRDVITKKGKIYRVKPNKTVDSTCGPLVVVKKKELKKME